MVDHNLLQRKKLFLFDLDGTLYLGNRLFEGVRELLSAIRARGGQYRFLTNNSSRSVEAYVEKFTRLGVATEAADFLTSVDALIHYLREHGGEDRRYYVCGTESMKSQLRAAGFTVAERREDANALLMGFDTELTFQKLEDACILLGQGIPYLATNPDWVCPTACGFVPDCGSVCEMLWRATSRRPIVIGKPEPLMPQLAMLEASVSAQETLLVGDRIYTDIASGANAGIDTLLVLSGETKEEDLPTADPAADVRSAGRRCTAEHLRILKRTSYGKHHRNPRFFRSRARRLRAPDRKPTAQSRGPRQRALRRGKSARHRPCA